MKLFHTLGVLIALAFAVTSPAAEERDSMRVHVPFAFVVAGQEFAPGDYSVHENDNGIVFVQGGGKGAITLSYPPVTAARGSVTGLRFTKSGQKEYLVGVQYEQLSRSIPIPASGERKLTLTSQ